MQFADDELRVLSVGAPIFLRMLRTRERAILDQMYGKFLNGQTDFVADMARYAVVRDQIREITTALKLQDKE